MASARDLLRFIPPATAITVAVVVLVSTSAGAFLLHMLTGVGVTVAFLLGATAGVPSATAAAPPSTKLIAASLCVVAAIGGALVSSSPWGSAALVGALGLAQAPLTQRAAGIGLFAPVIAAVFATVDTGDDPLLLGVGTAIGFTFAHGLVMLLKLPRTTAPVARTTAWLHAAVFALLAVPGVFITRSLDLGHGFWLVLTLAAVLRPAASDSREAASARLAGTVFGIWLAIAMGVIVSGPILLLLTAAFAVLMIAWAACKDVEKQALFGTPVILLVVSGGQLSHGVGLGLERLALTAVACGLALAAAAVLEHPKSPAPTQPAA